MPRMKGAKSKGVRVGNWLSVQQAQKLLNQPGGAELIALDGALERLFLVDPRKGRTVELRFFGGLTEDETAEILGVSPATVRRDWRSPRPYYTTNSMRRPWTLRRSDDTGAVAAGSGVVAGGVGTGWQRARGLSRSSLRR
jgi:ECF sigma factor